MNTSENATWVQSGNPLVDVISSIATVADITVGLICNTRVVWLLMWAKGGLVTSDLFFFNLAFTELLICPSIFFNMLNHLNLGIDFSFPALDFFFSFVLIARPFFRCCICVDRYLAVVHPIVYLKYKAMKYRLVCLAFVWLLTFGYCVAGFFTHSSLVLGMTFFPVLVVDSFCSLSILRVLKQPRPGDGEQEEMNAMKRRAFKTVLVIQVMMVLNYTPMLLFTAFGNLITDPEDVYQFFSAAFTFLALGSFVDPLLYLSRAGKLPCTKRS